MEFFKIRRSIPFMRHALVFNVISIVVFLASVFFLATKGLHFSIEFTGGSVLEVSYPQAADPEGVRGTLEKIGLKDVSVQTFGTSRDVLIRLPLKAAEGQSQSDAMQKLTESVVAALTAAPISGEAAECAALHKAYRELIATDLKKRPPEKIAEVDRLRQQLCNMAVQIERHPAAGLDLAGKIPARVPVGIDEGFEGDSEAARIAEDRAVR